MRKKAERLKQFSVVMSIHLDESVPASRVCSYVVVRGWPHFIPMITRGAAHAKACFALHFAASLRRLVQRNAHVT